MLTLLIGAALALGPAEAPRSDDPLAAERATRDAEGIVVSTSPAGAPPTAEQIHRAYLDGASAGVRVFSPERLRTRRMLGTRWSNRTTPTLEQAADTWRSSEEPHPSCASRVLRSMRCSREARSDAVLW
ncbi:hypothetical protein ACBY01_03900 [Sphingomonas sp. ac-8]|uniref:hypothetical protein n=1 Tax=Sphingomonas sp. ac-8 TaxID=3242977 RepID=UPI003A7FE37B